MFFIVQFLSFYPGFDEIPPECLPAVSG